VKSILYIHKQNMSEGKPCIIVKTPRGATHYSRVEILGPSTVIQSLTPGRHGVRAWIETEAEVRGE
jgi:hypothetical protein